MKLSLKGGSVLKQLSLFSAEELEKCNLTFNIIQNVRRQLYADKLAKLKKQAKLGKVIQFPKKFVS